MSRIKKFIKPKLTLRPDVVHAPVDATTQSQIWAGLSANTALAYTQIWGSWTIPFVLGAVNDKCAMWVGLQDGRSLFQAGTDCTPNFPFLPPATDTCYTWYEWFPGPRVAIGLG
jgi:hypothetical protein